MIEHQSVRGATTDKFIEFELVKQALYVDPYDQSGWIYHRWLVGTGISCRFILLRLLTHVITGDDRAILEREIKIIEDLLELEPGAKCAS